MMRKHSSFLMHRYFQSETFRVLVPAVVISLALVAAQNTEGIQAQLFWFSNSRSVQPIATCRDAGLCGKNERNVILHSTDGNAVANAVAKGCVVRRQLRNSTALRCPSKSSIPYSHEERALRVNELYSNQQVGADVVQAAGTTGSGVMVAVLDTGVDTEHPELAGKITMRENFTTDDIEDYAGHGTHVAGIIAGSGIAEFSDRDAVNRALGVAPGVSLLAGKVCNNQGWCLESDIKAGIEWAVRQHARVINLSLGAGAFLGDCDRDALADDVNWAVSQGVVTVVAAGNGGDTGEGVSTPGCASKAIAVGAVDTVDSHPSWSSYGKAIDVVAPGVGILSAVSCLSSGTCPNPAYGWWSGTSMATPQVTGLVALLLQADPTLTPDQVYALVTQSTVDVGDTGFDILYGYGRIDAVNTLEQSNTNEGNSSSTISSAASSVTISSNPSSAFASSAASDGASFSEKSWYGNTAPSDYNPSADRQNVPTLLPPLPSNAPSAAQEHRPSAPRGAPRW